MASAAPNPLPAEPRRFWLPRPLWISVATVVLVGVAVGLRIGIPIYRHLVLFDEVERLGGRIEAYPGRPEWLQYWLGREMNRRMLGEVVQIDLNRTMATDDTLEKMKEQTDVKVLILTDTEVTDAGLAHLD